MSRIRKIIEIYIKGIYSENIQMRFGAWLKENKQNEEKNAALTDIWESIDVEADSSTKKSLDQLLVKIQKKAKRENKSYKTNVSAFWNYKLTRIAAILVLPILSAMFTYLWLEERPFSVDNVKFVECIVPNGETRTITLPDSSKIQLNAGSIFIYPEHFDKNRNVYLNGEGYFNVFKNTESPFIVNTVDMQIEVLGTVFNVSSYTEDKTSSAMLESGKVSIFLKNGANQKILLAPNERLAFNRKEGMVEREKVEPSVITAWTKNNLVIQALSIEEIAKVIERKFNMEVYLNSNRYKDELITIKLDNDENIIELLNIMKHIIPGFKYKIDMNKLYIY